MTPLIHNAALIFTFGALTAPASAAPLATSSELLPLTSLASEGQASSPGSSSTKASLQSTSTAQNAKSAQNASVPALDAPPNPAASPIPTAATGVSQPAGDSPEAQTTSSNQDGALPQDGAPPNNAAPSNNAAPNPDQAAPSNSQPVQPNFGYMYAGAPPSGGPPPGYQFQTEAPPPEVEKPLFHTLILVEAVAKYGSLGHRPDGYDSNRDASSTGLFGGQATLGLLPGGKYFTMGARISGGALVGGPGTLGTIGASMLFGAHFLRNDKGNTFSYALAGAGVEFIPGLNEDMLAFHLSGGTVVNGLSFSAGLDLGSNQRTSFALFGMQIGWGHLY